MPRSCGYCSLCCKLKDVRPTPDDPFEKRGGEWCKHCKIGSGCAIYEQRFQVCRDFKCLWLESDKIGEHWYPLKSKMILIYKEGNSGINELVINCDIMGVWRRDPYFSDIKKWMKNKYPLMVRVTQPNGRGKVLLPDYREVDCGNEDEVTVGETSDGDWVAINEEDGSEYPSLLLD